MPRKDLHEKPFDESTIDKLEIFEDYAQAWIPTFVMSGVDTICIFDFFAGTGYDKDGVEGSPIRILKKIKEQIGNIFQKKVKVLVFLNEWEPDKTDQPKFVLLKQACEDFLAANKDVGRAIEIKYFNEDFEVLFPKLLPLIKRFPSLVYLDQNGIKFLSEKYFLELEKTSQTDFLYFVAASHFWRFGDRPAFKMHLDIDMEMAKKNPYRFIHQSIIEQLRTKLPVDTKFRLYPFSLKKGANIHGIIFGASHPAAVDKFLHLAWKRNDHNGVANFDIDDDRRVIQGDLFLPRKMSRKEAFCKDLRTQLLNGHLKTNEDVLEFSQEHGVLPSLAADEIKKMKKRN